MKRFGFTHFKQIIKLGGVPGYLLIGYYVVQVVFARGKADMAAIDGAAIIFASYAALCGLYSWHDFQKNRYGRFFLKQLFLKTGILWFSLYTLIAFISSCWSPIPILSAYRAVECMGMLLLNAAIIKNLLALKNEYYAMLWSVCYAFLMLSFTFASSFKGGGIYMALYNCQFPATIFFYLAFYFAPSWWIKYPIELLAIFCKSVTGYCGMALGLCSLMFGSAKYRLLGGAIAVGLLFAVSTIGFDELLNQTIFASKGGVLVDGEIDPNKTSGRSNVWELAIRKITEENHLYYGYGFVAGETVFARRIQGPMVIGMHNGFLSALIGTGLFGLITFALFMVQTSVSPFNRKIPNKYKTVLIASLCVILVHTVGNPGLGFRVYGTWMPAMYIVMLINGFYIKYTKMK